MKAGSDLTRDGRLFDTDWYELLKPELKQPYWAHLAERVERERAQYEVFPPRDSVFRAFCMTSCADTKVVIVGQDPYARAGQADGLCFSVQHAVPIPPSLRNIRK